MENRKTPIQEIINQRVLPLFYHDDPEVSLEVIRSLYNAGIRVIEYTRRGPAALENFLYLKKNTKAEFPDLYLGIGTIKNKKEASEFMNAGSEFIVCPIVDAEIANLVHEAGLMWVPGCFTPTEINFAYQLKAQLIKIFPAQFLGSEYLSAIREIFPGQLFMPTGGVELEKSSIEKWFKSGVCAVGMGSKLITKDILEKKQYTLLYEQTKYLLQLTQGI